jgi:hypothetical protein
MTMPASWRSGAALFCLMLTGVAAAEEAGAPIDVRVEVDPVEATVGDPLNVRLLVSLPSGTRLDPPEFGPALGALSVVEGSWSGPEQAQGSERWTWTGVVVSFRPGEVELPALRIVVEDAEGAQREVQSEPVEITILSVLEPVEAGDSEEALADLKPPASLPADYGPLLAALGILAALLLASALLWWLHRRYAARLAAVPVPDDPFRRTPPHEWVYAELQKLLERRLAEQGQVAAFHAELSHILKRYLGGRYRVELMERTTAELPERLQQAGAPAPPVEAACELLGRCDLVKFAKQVVGSEECRASIEEAYRIVDATKPRPLQAEVGAA